MNLSGTLCNKKRTYSENHREPQRDTEKSIFQTTEINLLFLHNNYSECQGGESLNHISEFTDDAITAKAASLTASQVRILQ